MQKIISWNVASIRARMPALLKLLDQEKPDIVLLQETKATDEVFPFFELQLAGYDSVTAGQKALNGVAILSRSVLVDVVTTLPGVDMYPDEARFVQGTLSDGVVVISVYIPNGNPPLKEPDSIHRLEYKLAWMQALTRHIKELLNQGKSVILGGDFNVIAMDTDVYNPNGYRNNALMVPSVRSAFKELCDLSVFNALRHFHPEEHYYSFWDYQMGAWARNLGMLLDYIFVSDSIRSDVTDSGVLKDVRGWEKTSDHAPVYCVLSK